jgi:hypothetical protein
MPEGQGASNWGSAIDFGGQVLQMGLNYEMQKKAAKKQQGYNMELAQYQNDANLQYMREMNAYNTPAMQMGRFQDAGLNKNLIYGQGNPGNQSSSVQAASVKPADLQSFANILPAFNQTRLVDSQVQAQNAQTMQRGALTRLTELQAKVVEKNPLLNDVGFQAIIDGLKSSAEIKAADSTTKRQIAEWSTGEKSFKVDGIELHGPAGALKLETELNLLQQRFNLGSQDAAVKAEIVKSKEFQNAILEVQKKFMTDGDITPQHILTFIQLLLMKLL